MNMNRLINMVIRQVVRQVVNRGVKAGAQKIAEKGDRPAPQQDAKRAGQAMKMLRRVSRF